MSLFKGCGVAMATPFKEGGVNYDASERLIEFLIDGGVDAIIVLGTTGEAMTMSDEEKSSLVRFTVEKAKSRVPIIVGTGSNNTDVALQQSLAAQELGADGLMIVTPYYNKCTPAGLIRHYSYIAARVELPIIVYNVPGRTGMNVKPETLFRLAEIPNIIAIKEAGGSMEQMQEMIAGTSGAFDVYSGEDAITAASMAMGASGVISVVANAAPKLMSGITSACLNNDFKKARELQFLINPLVKALFSEVNPIPVKKALEFLGIDAGIPRMPLTEMEESTAATLKAVMQKLKLI